MHATWFHQLWEMPLKTAVAQALVWHLLHLRGSFQVIRAAFWIRHIDVLSIDETRQIALNRHFDGNCHIESIKSWDLQKQGYPTFCLRVIMGCLWVNMGCLRVVYGLSETWLWWIMGYLRKEFGIFREEYGVLREEYGIWGHFLLFISKKSVQNHENLWLFHKCVCGPLQSTRGNEIKWLICRPWPYDPLTPMLWKAEATPSSQVDQNLIQPGFFKQAFISAS